MTADTSGNTASSAARAAFTVVITRPAGQSVELVRQLEAAGIATLEFPLIDIAPVADDAPLRAALGALERYALVVFVSPNAVDHAFARRDGIWPHALPVGVVGPGSVQALARHGVAAPAHRVISPAAASDDEAASFDSEGLYAAIEATLGETGLEGKRVLIVRGDGGREWLAERLREAGAEVEAVAAYRRIVPEPSIGGWTRVHALLAGAPHAWLLTSSEGVRNLHELAQDHLTGDEITQLKHAQLVTPHPRIAQTARALGFDRITVSGAGDERIVAALVAAVPPATSPAVSSAVLSSAVLSSTGSPGTPPVTASSTAPAAQRQAPSAIEGATEAATEAATSATTTATTQSAAQSATESATEAAPRSATQSAAQSRAQSPAQSRMTETNASTNASSQPAATAALPPNPPFTPYEAQQRRNASGPLLWFVVVIIACAAGVGGYALNRKVQRTEQQLAQRQQTNDTQTNELRIKVEQALATVHQSDAQVAQLQGKLADAQAAQQALQQQYADLARNRDDWTLAEVGQMLSAASQQLQLTGNTQLALFALQSADTRLAASDSPQAVAVRKAIAQDIDKLKAAPSTDLTGLAIKLDNAIDHVDALPLAGEAPIPHATPKAAAWADTDKVAAATGKPRWEVWLREMAAGIGQQLTSLVQVRRIDNADAMLATPDQGYFVRQNLKLRLLSARLALLSRNQNTLKSDLQAAQTALTRYFDASSKDTQTVLDLVKQVDAGSAAVELPNLDTSLQAVNQYRNRG